MVAQHDLVIYPPHRVIYTTINYNNYGHLCGVGGEWTASHAAAHDDVGESSSNYRYQGVHCSRFIHNRLITIKTPCTFNRHMQCTDIMSHRGGMGVVRSIESVADDLMHLMPMMRVVDGEQSRTRSVKEN